MKSKVKTCYTDTTAAGLACVAGGFCWWARGKAGPKRVAKLGGNEARAASTSGPACPQAHQQTWGLLRSLATQATTSGRGPLDSSTSGPAPASGFKLQSKVSNGWLIILTFSKSALKLQTWVGDLKSVYKFGPQEICDHQQTPAEGAQCRLRAKDRYRTNQSSNELAGSPRCGRVSEAWVWCRR